jgi:hypothetical protein
MRNRSPRWSRRERLQVREAGLIRGFAENCKDVVPEPSKGALKRIQQILAYWQEEMHLTEWQLHCRFVARGDEWTARIWIHDDFSVGMVEVGDDLDEEEWDWIIVHELVHLLLYPTSVLCDTMQEHLDRHQSEIMEPLLKNAEEIAVNRLTEAIVGKRLPVVWGEEEENV